MDKINFDGFPPEERQWVLEFRQILEKLDLANLAKSRVSIRCLLMVCQAWKRSIGWRSRTRAVCLMLGGP